MNAQVTAQHSLYRSYSLGRFRLHHCYDGTFWIHLIQGKAEVPLIGVDAPTPPIELQTVTERHALFVRHCDFQQGEVTLWDERVIDGVPVRWEILLREDDEGDLHLQVHFLSYGSLQAEVRYLYQFSGENFNIRAFACPYPYVLLTAPRHSLSVTTLQPWQPDYLRVESGDRLVWALPPAHLHQQTLQVRIHYEKASSGEQTAIQHIERRASWLPLQEEPIAPLQLRAAAQNAVALLLKPEWHSRFAEDQLVMRVAPEDRRFSVFTLAAAKALSDWSRFSGDDKALWTARLAMNSAMDFQLVNAQSANSGACWDTLGEDKRGSDILGQQRFHLHRNARVLYQTLLLHRDTGSELCVRVALNGLSWVLLKRGATGVYDGAEVLPDGKVQGGSGKGIAGATISLMCAAYSLTETEAYMHAANRLAEHVLQEACASLSPGFVLPEERFPALQDDVFAAADAVEGLVRLHRAYPHASLREGALRMIQWLRLWQLSTMLEGLGEAGEVVGGDGAARGFFDASVEAARGALWALSLERDARWFAYATRALHAAAGYFDPLAGLPHDKLAYPDHTQALAAFVRTYLQWLLSLPTLAPGVECDPDLMVCRTGNRIFVPEPSLWRSLRVQTRGLVDWVALACPATHDVLLAVLANSNGGVVLVEAGEHRQVAHDLMSGERSVLFQLHTLPGVGSVGVYILQA
ncbi:MAG: hypothetical protein NZ520_09860 [bacterium]|nr:hypothetical protein [bacterium]